jgi:oligopeptide transport system substrate-binding protein
MTTGARWLPLARVAPVVLCALLAWPVAAQVPATAADPAKVLRVMIPVAETGFDPQASSDYYSNTVISAIFDTLYEWDYLARPHRLVPRTAEAMPEISADGTTWTIRLKRGITFADDPAFKGKRRELTAQDYVYSWARLVDPRVRSPNVYIVRGKLLGVDAAMAQAKAAGRFDYDAPIEGLRALDRYTLQLRLTEADYTFLPYLAATQMAAVAREVVEAYGDASGWVMANPVGTGPFRLVQWRRSQKIVLEANPTYREEFFPAAPDGADAATRAMAAAMKGKRLPRVGRVEVSVIEEPNPALLAFNNRELDYIDVPRDHAGQVLDGANRLVPAYAQQGIELQRAPEAGLAWFAFFNMDDPVVGGTTPEKVALRRAVLAGYNVGDMIQVALQGQGTPATQPIPPEVAGHSPSIKAASTFDPALARALLDKFGYRDRDGDGYRELPDGKPLTLMMGSAPTSENRTRDELWAKNMRAIGIRIDFVRQKWPDLVKMARAGQLQMWQVGWAANSADPYMQLCYGPSVGETNLSRFRNADYDELYRQSRKTASETERGRLYARMTEIVAAYAPMGGGVYRIENTMLRPWISGYRKDNFRTQQWRWVDIDVARRTSGK